MQRERGEMMGNQMGPGMGQGPGPLGGSRPPMNGGQGSGMQNMMR